MNPDDLDRYFQAASQRTGVPVALLKAQARQESGLNPNAVGKAGEIGLTQIMPSTARSPGFGVQGVDPQTLKDPAANAMFGAQYLAGRAKAAGVTDWNNPEQVARALRAYNGGGDPNYAQNVMRFMPGGSQAGAQPNYAAKGGGYDSPRERNAVAAANPASALDYQALNNQPKDGTALGDVSPGLLGGLTSDKLKGAQGLLGQIQKQQSDDANRANQQTQMLWQMASKGGNTQPMTPFTGFQQNIFGNGLLG